MPPFALPHFNLRIPQGGSRSRAFRSEHLFVEPAHHSRSGAVIYFPETGDNPRGAGVHEATGQSHEPFPFDLLSHCRLTGAQDYKVGGKIEIVDFVQPKETILWPSRFIDE